MKQLDDLIQRVKEAKKHELTLSSEDCALLLHALITLASIQERLQGNEITIYKLRKLLGMITSSEKLSQQVNTSKNAALKTEPAKKIVKKVQPKIEKHALEAFNKGDECPLCLRGKLYKYDPATLLRITGQSPFVPTQHIMERLRCSTCGSYFTAPLPKEVEEDGESGHKYGYSARSLMGICKFYAGLPYFRQESLQNLLGISISASAIFDQTEHLANSFHPIFKLLRHKASDAKHFYIDDTSQRILNQKPIVKKKRNSDKEQLRSGIYTSGLIAKLESGEEIILFESNIGHAGEFIDSILQERTTDIVPSIMSDALSANGVTTLSKYINSLCNSHARRQFYDVQCHFPEEVNFILDLYGKIWFFDKQTREMTDTERLAYHKTHSLPIMQQIKEWGAKKLEGDDVEANSSLGKAIAYFLRHYDELTSFCYYEGVAIDNNPMESQLKLVVRNRKNALFFQTLSGASIGDVITSMIATAIAAGVNAFDYFNVLQREQELVKENPTHYLPWNYKEWSSAP